MKDKATQTGEITDEVLQLCTIAGLDPLNLFLPAESEQIDIGRRKCI